MRDLHSDVVPFRDLPDPTNLWDLQGKIGEGTYGTVYRAKQRDTGQEVAIKVLESVDEILDEVEQEYVILRDLSNHANIPQFYGLFLKPDPKQDQLWITMELCSGGSVTELVKARLQKGHRMDEHVIAHILKETMKGLQHLHEHHVMHRDVKGHNILLTQEGKVKLIDFGVSRKLKNTQDQCCTSLGTPFWMAPEVIACEQQVDTNYDIRCDIWSLGITAIELADGDPPLADLHPMRALFKIPRNPAPSVRKKDDWSRNFLHFIDRCVQKDFEKRPYLSELFCHPFITQVPPNTSKLKTTLQDLLRRTEGAVHEPQATVKHGQLRMRHQMDSISAVNDLATLEALDKGMIVDHLERRYNNSLIYTYIGDILLAVNPFNPLTIYTEQYSRLYRHSAKADHPPHIFAMADQTYQSMVHGRCNQCIVISGESGAGKTESANFLIQQLTQLGRAPNRDLEERILQVNPLMEAFGNAQTVINSNSSRFGKYLEMTFTGSGKVTGARLSEYLLERSRVVNHAKGETNFHVFYYLYDGLVGSEKAARYYLTEKVNYRYLGSNRGHGCVLDVRTATASKNKCKTIQRCFEIIGFRTQEVSAIFSILSAILHIGNIDFLEKEVKHQTTTIIGDTDLIQIVAELLGVDARELRVSLTTSSMVARGEMIVRHNSVTECIDCRDALSKEIYGRLFCWLVNQVNDLLRPSHSNEDSTESLTVGILDIFGFENFERNSFEQLCINIANEQIQYYFNQHVFAWEQQEYKNEGIDATEIKFVDNRPVLDMFLTKPMGLLALLDEESNFPKATDLTLVEKFGQNITSDIFSRPKSQGLVFTVQHYAGKVEYSAAGLLEKNRDRLAHEVMNMLRISQIALVRTIFCCSVTKTGNLASASDSNGGSSSSSFTSTISIRSASNVHSGVTSQARIQQTVATYFRYSLMDLLSKMVAGAPHFVRCIRPNTENSPGYFDPEKVEVQLKYTGVLETTHIRRLGFSHRIPFSEFLRRYAVLGLSLSEHLPANKDTCKQLLEQIGLENWALGNTKVFLKYYHVDLLCQLFEAKQRCIIRAQSVVRMRLQRKHYLQYKDRLYSSVVCIQKVIRGYHVRKQLYLVRQRRTAAAVLMQKMVRGFLQRRSYKIRREVTLHSCIIIQRGLRGWLARMRVRRLRISRQAGQQRAAVVLQCGVRAWQARNLRKTLEGHKAQYTAQTAKFMKQVRMSAAKVFLLTSKHQPRPKPVTKPEPVPNSELFMFWPGQNDTAATGQPNSGVTPQANGCIRSRAMSPVAVHHQSDRVDGHGRGSKVALSDDRLDHIKKAHDIKTPWTEKDAVYYDSISQDSNHEKRLWAEANRDCSKGDTKAGGVWDAPLQVAKEKAINDINQQERELELQRELAEVDEMFRSVLAASVAAKFLGSEDSDNADSEDEKMTGVKRKDSAPKLMNGQKGDMEGIVEKKEQQQESHKKRSSSKCDTSHADNNNTSTSQSEHCDDTTALDKCDGEGTVNFRSLLRKTNYDPKSTLRRLNASNDTVNQVDFRDVLKRKSSDVSRDRKTTVQHVS